MDHLTRLRLQTRQSVPFTLGALLGNQNGRDVEIVNTFELVLDDAIIPQDSTASGSHEIKVDHAFLTTRREQYKQVFPSLDFIGWYTVATTPTAHHIALHDQFIAYTTTPILLVLSPSSTQEQKDTQTLPFKAYEPTVEIRDRKSRTVFIEAPFKIETGEAERIAVDWTAKGGASGGSLSSHLQTQRAAIKMLHDRILTLVDYVMQVLNSSAQKDHDVLRSLSALVASLPASENKHFREEFEAEKADVILTSYLSTMTKAQNILNDVMDKYLVMTETGRERDNLPGGPRGKRRPGESRGAGGFGYRGYDDGDRWGR
ncbi:hypothetical protein FRB97_000105 [Tulasnella sp. 331]|nr:hypothetical protein FRB97_000105 [Tulasnella sp. 331]